MTKTKIVRIAATLLGILLVVSGVIGELRYGGICSLGTDQISVFSSLGILLRSVGADQISITCPLGFLERSLAVGELLALWPSVALVVVSVILLGRVFCAWICPAGLVHRLLRGKGGLRPRQEFASRETAWASYSSYAVLGGVLFASFLFRFPVFCFFCPIGLFFGAVYAIIRLFSPNPFSVELLLFPAVLGVELWVLKSWCRSICPLGALLSIAGNFNRFFLPVVSKDKCLVPKGINCQACHNACPEGIDLNQKRVFSPNSCTKCLDCADRCPVKAIKFPLRA